MDFHQNTQPETQNEQNSAQSRQMTEVPAPTQITNQDTVPTTGSISNQETVPAQQQSNQNPPANNMQNGNAAPYQNQQPYGNDDRILYHNQQPYGNDGRPSQQNQHPYGNNNGNPYQNRQPYGSDNRNPYQTQPPYQNGNPYSGNNQSQNNAPYGTGYPYYNRNAYQMPIAEPGSSLANASMILGIISIVTSFTFTVYPAFILGSIAVILALLSKGRRAKLISKARTGMICAVIGLITNTVLVTICSILLFTNSDVRAEVNQTFEEQYGVSFDEMMEEIMEDSGFSY